MGPRGILGPQSRPFLYNKAHNGKAQPEKAWLLASGSWTSLRDWEPVFAKHEFRRKGVAALPQPGSQCGEEHGYLARGLFAGCLLLGKFLMTSLPQFPHLSTVASQSFPRHALLTGLKHRLQTGAKRGHRDSVGWEGTELTPVHCYCCGS